MIYGGIQMRSVAFDPPLRSDLDCVPPVTSLPPSPPKQTLPSAASILHSQMRLKDPLIYRKKAENHCLP